MSAQLLRSTILLAEDDPNDVLLLKNLLSSSAAKYDLQIVNDGEEVIQYFEGSGRFADRAKYSIPAIVLLDIQLPKIDGVAVLKWIRQHPRWRGMVVVMLTGSESEEQSKAAYDLHVNSFLKKGPLLTMPEVSQNILHYWLNINQLPPRWSD